MEFKVTTPADIAEDNETLQKIVSMFEEEFKKEEKGKNYYHLVIVGEYSRNTLNKVEQIYSNAGWRNVICSTSSSKGEQSGLTGLVLEYKY